MSEKTDLRARIEATIAQFPDKTDAEIAELVTKEDGSHPTRSYVAKLRKKMGVTPTEKEAKEAEIKVEKEEVEVPEISEEPEAPPEAPAEEAKPGEAPTPDEIEQLRPIFKRSLGRVCNVVTERIAKLPEVNMSDQDLEDTQVITFLLVAKYAGITLEKWYLEVTAILHFTGIAFNAVIAKREKQKAEEEARRRAEEEARAREKPPETSQAQAEQPPKTFSKGETVPPFMRGKIGLEAVPDMEAEE